LVDTTGEGDAFLGGFAVGCIQNLDDSDKTPIEKKAIKLGNQCAFLNNSKYGAGPAMPFIDEIRKYFK
jgi:sugar/nucleoside kinase (ribokinase family)